jgi:hypothetical protein
VSYVFHHFRLRTLIYLIALFASDGDTFRREFKFCKKRNKWVGNPATCAEVKDLLTSLKNKAAADGERHHSAAMKYSYLAQMINWSESVCPFDPDSAPRSEDLTIEARSFQTEHIRFRAFASLAWTLWTRFATELN